MAIIVVVNDENDRAAAQGGDPVDAAAISRRRFLSTVGAGVGAAATDRRPQRYIKHVGSAIFAVPGGIVPGASVGNAVFA